MRRFISVGHLRINNKTITVRALTWDKIGLRQDRSTSDISVGHLRINNKTITVRALTQDKIELRQVRSTSDIARTYCSEMC